MGKAEVIHSAWGARVCCHLSGVSSDAMSSTDEGPSDLLAIARDLMSTLEQLRASGFSDHAALARAKTLNYMLAPAYEYLYGATPLIQVTPLTNQWWNDAWEHASQVAAALEAGHISRVRPPRAVWADRELPILSAVANAELKGQTPRRSEIQEATGLDSNETEFGLRALLGSGHLDGIDASSMDGFDVIDLTLTERGRRASGVWPQHEGEMQEPDKPKLGSRGVDGFQFDVAISVAGPDRPVAAAVVDALRQEGITVWYDQDQENVPDLWGEDVPSALAEVMAERARFVMVFLSEHYTESQWTKFELSIASSAAVRRRTAYVLPVRVSETVGPVVGLSNMIGFIDLATSTPEQIAQALKAKLSASQ